MKKRHTETAARATAVLLTAATLASGTVMEAPTTWAVEQNQNPNASETQNTIRERLEQAVKDASARKDIQSSTSGAAYTADTYGTFEARLTEAQNSSPTRMLPTASCRRRSTRSTPRTRR